MKSSLFIGACLLVATGSSAQNLLGLSTSRYGGTNRLYMNPALVADSPSRLYLNVGVVNAHVNNNYVRYQAPFSLVRLLSGNVPAQYKNGDGSLNFSIDYTRETLDGKPKNGTIWGEVRGPAILIRSGSGSGLAITTRFRAIGEVIGASESLLSAVRAGLNDNTLYSIPSNNNQFSVNTNTYSELGLTYGGTVWEGDGQRLLLGATAKVLLGYNAQQLINRGLDYRIVADPVIPNSAYLEVDKLDATLNYTTFLQNRTLGPRTLFSPSAPGRGFGVDLGLTYISQYDADSPALRLGVALTDLGGITYKGEQYTYTDIGQQPIRFTGAEFNNVSGSEEILRIIQQKLDQGRSPNQGSFSAGLPTSLNLSVDYQLPDGVAIGVTYLKDVRSAQAMAVHQPTLLAVTPRYDTRWVSVAVPVAYLNGGFTAGASLRVGPAWLGTDNFLGLIGNTSNGIQPRGLDVYGGIAFGLGRADEEQR
ncbi:hypothetical protein HNV11_10240 [Spirosoma taeanense]|uniref:DUF5723 domain-containing protein n=1 Tax=Spirosoma taeanense TaxID=2735870 RepID=A0A6M5Y934_9BACT|nr:DUF5723 family protein [Spirosoma taeanense]QJW89731.1 hypothetical protein HNV11_10240 [Spirosoma taeanense]